MSPVLVDERTIDDANVFLHAVRLKASGATPPLISFDCGVDDELIRYNRDLDAHLTRIGIDLHYAEHPGAHDRDYWDEHVQEALAQHAGVLGLDRVQH